MADFELTPPPAAIKDKNSPVWTNWLNKVYEKLRGPMWEDLTTGISSGKVPAANAPTWDSAMGNGGTQGAYKFAVNDYIDLEPFHIKHDIKPGSKMYPHVHWTISSTATESVKWQLTYSIAKGHQQESFPVSSTVTVEGTPTGDAWEHMISEVTDANAIDAPEVDSLIFCRLTRITNGGSDNANNIFGLTVDMHYQKDRFGTPNKAPDFYKRGN